MQGVASHPKGAPVQLRTERDIISEREIERKFLIEKLPSDLEKYPHVEIAQGNGKR